MTVSNNEVLRCSARQTGTSGQDIVNVFHFRAAFAVDQDDATVLSEVHQAIDAAMTQFNAVLSSTYNPVDIKVDVVQWILGKEEVTRNVGTILWSGTYNPAGSGDDLPPGACGFVKLLTGVGKTYGRKFISGIRELNGVSGFVDASVQAALGAFATTQMTNWIISAGNEFEWGVMSKKSFSFKKFVAYAASAAVAYQRRRKLGTGS